MLCLTLCWQVTKNDLEQRHSQLDDIFTLAQNIKNKTSNLDVRTSITEKCMYRAAAHTENRHKQKKELIFSPSKTETLCVVIICSQLVWRKKKKTHLDLFLI